MKIQIVDKSQKGIVGYNIISLDNIDNEFENISNNSCESILANNIFDYVELKDIVPTIQKLLLKLRIGGSMVIGGKDINLFCKSFKNNLISEEDASNIIASCQLLISYKTVENLIRQLGLKYITQLNGVRYEITVSR